MTLCILGVYLFTVICIFWGGFLGALLVYIVLKYGVESVNHSILTLIIINPAFFSASLD